MHRPKTSSLAMHVECGSRDAALRVFTSAGTLVTEKQPQHFPRDGDLMGVWKERRAFDDSSVVDIGLMKIGSLM